MVVELRSAIFQGDPARIANELLEKVKTSVSEHLPIGTWWLRMTWPKETKVIKINGKCVTYRTVHDPNLAGQTSPKISVRAMRDVNEAEAIQAFF